MKSLKILRSAKGDLIAGTSAEVLMEITYQQAKELLAYIWKTAEQEPRLKKALIKARLPKKLRSESFYEERGFTFCIAIPKEDPTFH